MSLSDFEGKTEEMTEDGQDNFPRGSAYLAEEEKKTLNAGQKNNRCLFRDSVLFSVHVRCRVRLAISFGFLVSRLACIE